MERNKVLVLASGGLDSSVLLALYSKLGYEVHILYVNYGNKNVKEEEDHLMNLAEKLSIPYCNHHSAKIKMGLNNSAVTGDSKDPYVCMRNMILASLAISKAEELDIPEVALGLINVREPYRDADSYFVSNMNKVSVESCGVSVKAPLIAMTKQQVYDLGKSLGITIEDTFSCFNPIDGKPCGECPACQDITNLYK